jgi:putative membrane protein
MSMTEDEGRSATSDEVPGGAELEVPRTRTSSAWVAAAIGALLVLLMLVFILQNGDTVQMHFLWTDFSLPLGVGLLLAGVLGALIVVALGIGRMLQLRLAARRHRKADRRAAAVTGMGSRA